MRRREHLVSGASASKVCLLRLTEGLLAAPFVGLCSALFPRDRPRWSFPSWRCAGGHPMSPLYTCVWGDHGLCVRPASVSGLQSHRSSVRVISTLECDQHSSTQLSSLRLAMHGLVAPGVLPQLWPLRLCASWSAGTPRRRRACTDRPVSTSGGAFQCGGLYSSSRACAVSPQQARPAPRPVAAREYPHREALQKVFCSPRTRSELLLSLHCDSCSWMIGTFLALSVHRYVPHTRCSAKFVDVPFQRSLDGWPAWSSVPCRTYWSISCTLQCTTACPATSSGL